MFADPPDDAPPPPAAPNLPPAPEPSPRVVRSEDLFEGRRELLIRHGESLYRLRITAQGRLILTK